MRNHLCFYLFLFLLASCAMEKKTVVGADNNPLTAYDSISAACGLYSFSINAFESMSEGKDTNYVFSPFGTAALFTMLQEGSSGKTYEELQKVMCVNSNIMAGMVRELESNGTVTSEKNTVVSMANMVAVSDKYRIDSQFSKLIRSKYNAEAMRLDFNSPQSKKTINEWIAQHVHGIPNIIDGDISLSSDLYAINAMYFKGCWENKIDKKQTRRKCFHQYDGREMTVDMMNVEKVYPYFVNDTLQVVAMPYHASDKKDSVKRNCSMYVLLPREGYTIKDVKKFLHRHYIDYLQENMTDETVSMHLPRFNIETKTDVKQLLQSLGASHIDEFDGIANGPCELSQATQSAEITVDEEGTVAKAITIGEFNVTGNPSPSLVTVHNFNANRPFLYMIVNDDTGAILFMGQYTKGLIKENGKWRSMPYSGEKEKQEPLSYNEMRGGEVLRADEVIPVEPVRNVKKGKDYVYDVAEKMPSFPGGNKELMEYLEKNMKYPLIAKDNGIQGRVIAQFIVKANGHIENIHIAKSVDPLLDKEAIRLIKAMPRWEPGMQGGEKVNVRYTLPVTFRLK